MGGAGACLAVCGKSEDVMVRDCDLGRATAAVREGLTVGETLIAVGGALSV